MISFLKSLNKTTIFSILLVVPFLVACDNKEKSSDATSEEISTPQELTVEQKQQALDRATPGASNTNASGDVALNPPHGQPGHVCEIPVGQPLNQAQGNAPKMNVQSTNKASDGSIPAEGVKINPAHGQPGHRCDVKVGDPL